MKKRIFSGAATALITPFSNGKVDKTALISLIEDQIACGIDALVVVGTTGESATLTDEEKIDVVSLAVKTSAHRVPIIAGAGSNDTHHASYLCSAAKDVGADALLCVTPYYNKTSPRGVAAHFFYIADNTDLPLIVYNVPSRTGVDISPQTYAELANHPNIAAVKEADGNISKFARTVALVGDKLDFYSGNDDMTVPMMSLGGAGVISVLSNILPAEVRRMCALYFSGKTDEAARMQIRYLPLISALFADVNPIPVKYAMSVLEKCSDEVRLPLIPPDDNIKEKIRKSLADIGLLPGGRNLP